MEVETVSLGLEQNIVQTLVQKSNNSNNESAGFQGFDVEKPEVPEERLNEDNMVPHVPAQASSNTLTNPEEPVLNAKPAEADLQMVIDQVVDRMTPILQAICVTDRVQKAEQNAEEWKNLGKVLQSASPTSEIYQAHCNT